MFVSPGQLSALLLDALREPLQRLAQSSATAEAFAFKPERIPPHVILRHLAEHVFRIRMFRTLDSAATQLLIQRHSNVADLWARYARSESVHDRYFLRDLAAVGIPRDAIEGLTPFDATRRLGDFVGLAMRSYGALPVVLYSFWAEQNSEAGSTGVHSRTQALFGSDAARGAVAHRTLDDGQDHPALIARVLSALVRDIGEVLIASRLLDELTLLLQEYFCELEQWSKSCPAETFMVVPCSPHGEERVAPPAAGAAIA